MEKYKNHSEKIKKGQAKSDKKAGRPRKIDRNKIKELKKNYTIMKISKMIGISRQAIYNILNDK